MSKKLDSILSRVPPAVTNEEPDNKDQSDNSKQERIVAEIPFSLKKDIRIYLANHPKETERTVILKGLKAIGFDIKDIQIKDRRGNN